ncbi:MAG: hypothetical protein HUU19_12850 [Phycisphaerales bacterium]|nr:hypothetical protein [Phycisphaerales bacterium]
MSQRPGQQLENGKLVYQCLCCEQFTLDEAGCCCDCMRCGWCDDPDGNNYPTERHSPNYRSLTELRDIVRRFGFGAACGANRAGGIRAAELERMTANELSKLRTWEEESKH